MSENPESDVNSDDLFPSAHGVYFNADSLQGQIAPRYVAWVDLMGAKSIMSRSLLRAANFIGKVHVAALDAVASNKTEGGPYLEVFPVIDGAYFVAEDRLMLCKVLKAVYWRLATCFVRESLHEHRFLIRGGIALGNVIVGPALAGGADTLQKASNYSSCLAIGVAIGQAYGAETSAAPFGVFVDITARSIAPSGQQTFSECFWRWWDADDVQKMRVFLEKLKEYYAWLQKHSIGQEYPETAIKKHLAIAEEYFQV